MKAAAPIDPFVGLTPGRDYLPDIDPMTGRVPTRFDMGVRHAKPLLVSAINVTINVSVCVLVVWFGWHALNAGAVYLGTKIGQCMKESMK